MGYVAGTGVFGHGGGVDGGGGSGCVADTGVCTRSDRYSSVSLSIFSLIVSIGA